MTDEPEIVFGLNYREKVLALSLTPEELADRCCATVEWAREFLSSPTPLNDAQIGAGIDRDHSADAQGAGALSLQNDVVSNTEANTKT